MASKVEGDKQNGLICPVCLDVFKDATILNCGHTFCRGCLESHDAQHYELDHITCPVCRENTDLGLDRVLGLTPNFSLKGLVEALNADCTSQVDDRSSDFCSLHKDEYKTIFCEVCKEFICISFFINSHQGHKIRKTKEAELAENELKKKTDDLLQKCKERKIQIEQSVNSGYHFQEVVNSHLDNLDKEVRDTFAKKSTILRGNEEILLGKINELRRESVNRLDNWISHRTQLINSTDCEIAELSGNTSKTDKLQSQYLKCSELSSLLKVTIEDDSASHIKERVESAQFRVADEKLLDLGCIDVGVKAEASNSPSASTINDSRRKSEETQESNIVADIPPVVKYSSLRIVKKVELKHDVCGMASLSEDAVVVGYGGSRKGSDCISLSGHVRPHLKKTVGHVNGIAFLTDGRAVVAHSKKTFSVYNPQGTYNTGMQKCKPGDEYLMVCSDQHDKIYAVNSNPQIYIFQDGMSGKPQRIVPTGDIEPKQICVTKAGDAMIISTCDSYPSTVTVYDAEGQRGTSIGETSDLYNNDDDDDDDDYDDEYEDDGYDDVDGDDDDDFGCGYDDDGVDDDDDDKALYAAVDRQDRVLVATVSDGSDRFRLTRYTLQGRKLVEEMIINRSILHDDIDDTCCHMVSLTSNLISFANGSALYFMELAD